MQKLLGVQKLPWGLAPPPPPSPALLRKRCVNVPFFAFAFFSPFFFFSNLWRVFFFQLTTLVLLFFLLVSYLHTNLALSVVFSSWLPVFFRWSWSKVDFCVLAGLLHYTFSVPSIESRPAEHRCSVGSSRSPPPPPPPSVPRRSLDKSSCWRLSDVVISCSWRVSASNTPFQRVAWATHVFEGARIDVESSVWDEGCCGSA